MQDPLSNLANKHPENPLLNPVVTFRNSQTKIPTFKPKFSNPETPQPVVFADPDLYEETTSSRAIYSHPDAKRYKYLIYPLENLNRSIFINRCGLKLANLDLLFDLTNHQTGSFNKQTIGHFKFCDIAGGPGGFSQYIIYRRPEAVGYGISAKKFIDWSQELLDTKQFLPLYGTDNSGDLFTQWQWFRDDVLMRENAGYELVVADGGFEAENKVKEFQLIRLLMIEIYLGIAVTEVDGHFVVKVYDTVTKITGDLIYLLSFYFQSVSLFKPLLSRSTNSEAYLICKNRNSRPEKDLENVILETSEDRYPSQLFDETDSRFEDWLTKNNEYRLTKNLSLSETMKDLVEGKRVIHKENIRKIDHHQILVALNVPGEVYR